MSRGRGSLKPDGCFERGGSLTNEVPVEKAYRGASETRCLMKKPFLWCLSCSRLWEFEISGWTKGKAPKIRTSKRCVCWDSPTNVSPLLAPRKSEPGGLSLHLVLDKRLTEKKPFNGPERPKWQDLC